MLPGSASLGQWSCMNFQEGHIDVPTQVSTFFKCLFYELNTGFNLPVTLVVICQQYHLLNIDAISELLEPI